MRTQTKSLLISLIIVVVSFIFLGPRIVYPTQPVVLLNQTVVLTEDNYQTQYTLTLSKGDQLNIQLSGNGDLVSLTIAQSSSPTNLLVDQELQTTLILTWASPQTGLYIFTVSAFDGATATITVTKT